MSFITAIVLTKNEEIHLERCLRSLSGAVDHILVVDCGSTDKTLAIAKDRGARVEYNEWTNYSNQFNHALSMVSEDSEWIFRIDADEYIDEKLRYYLCHRIRDLAGSVTGISFVRQMCFLGQPIKHGGVFPIWQLRLFRRGAGECEKRWMDEHIVLNEGNVLRGAGVITDCNLNTVGWWVDKHNSYAAREAIDILSYEYPEINPFLDTKVSETQAASKRRMKRIYSLLPVTLRAFIYFVYRYFLKVGFLDGKKGLMFHFLQGFWYRFLVDVRCYEVKEYATNHNVDIREAILKVLKIKV